MIDEYLKQMLVSDYKDPTYTIVISSLDTSEECDHEEIVVGLKQYNPSIYDLFKAFYIQTKELTPTNEQTLEDINQEATEAVDAFLDSEGYNVTYNDRKLVLRSGLEYDNNQGMYRSVLNANIVDGLPTSTSRDKCIITSDDSDIFSFNTKDDIYIPLYLKTDYNEVLKNQILMITLMDRNRNNIFDHKVILVTDKKGHVLYYPTALPIERDIKDYVSGEVENPYYYTHSEFYNDGVPRYLYYIKVDYPGTEKYEATSKEFKIYISKGKKSNIDSGGS